MERREVGMKLLKLIIFRGLAIIFSLALCFFVDCLFAYYIPPPEAVEIAQIIGLLLGSLSGAGCVFLIVWLWYFVEEWVWNKVQES